VDEGVGGHVVGAAGAWRLARLRVDELRRRVRGLQPVHVDTDGGDVMVVDAVLAAHVLDQLQDGQVEAGSGLHLRDYVKQLPPLP
jgi:hypothetical protein